MKNPRRRRRFFASSSVPYKMADIEEKRAVVDPSMSDPSPRVATTDADVEPLSGNNLKLPGGTVEFVPQDRVLPRPNPVFRSLARHRQPDGVDHFVVKMVVLALGCLALGGLGGYYLRKPPGKTPPASASSSMQLAALSLPPADEADLETAYATRHAGKFAEATQLFTLLESKHPNWAGMQLEVGRSMIYQKDFEGARVSLQAAVDKGLVPAEANFLLGVRNFAIGAYPDAELSFATAVNLDPRQADYYFLWGECLRTEGKLLQATAKFRSAFLRNQYETATGLYRLKMWLCEIESNQANGSGATAEIDAALEQPRPAMEVLFAAAARALMAGDITTATGYILRARDRADPTVFLVVMNDPLFAQARWTPEFQALLKAASSAAGLQSETSQRGASPVAATASSPGTSR